jgi:iron complex outermembrane recepter protein
MFQRKSRLSTQFKLSSASIGLVAGIVLSAGSASAQQEAANSELGSSAVESVVVTGTAFNTDAAPAKASLDTTEPQTIINRSYIDNYVDTQADYVSILAIVPGMTGGDSNGPGLSDGGAKNTLRGLPDGTFVQQWDGIPFGDTNGPTHHNISYFPASIIGSIVVDRGPGNAGNIGASTYGGTVKFFSQTLTPDFGLSGDATFGSFGTTLVGATVQSGDVNILGTTARGMVDFQDLNSEGALSLQNLFQKNLTAKFEDEFLPGWKATIFGSFNYINEHLDDNNGLTPAQVQVYGKNFALQNTNANLPTYQLYNLTRKETDMDYFRLTGTITSTLTIDNQAYTYAYWNHTFSPNSQTQTLANILAGTSQDNGKLTLENGTTDPNGVLAYDKQNAYRVFGDTLRLSQDYNLGWLSGQVRAGIWWEEQNTHRYKFYFDANQCVADDATPYLDTNNIPYATQECGVQKGSVHEPLYGYGKEDEYTRWNQYEPYLEVDLKPTDDLTITPGVKYIHWFHGDDSPMAQGTLCGVGLACTGFNALGQNFVESFVTTDTLPFLTVNYKIQPSWSVYFEYAKGIYVPDISTFEAGGQGAPTSTFPSAETTTNYQLGTVYYADKFTFDADVYYIGVNNNYISLPCSYDITDTCFENNGVAIYKGIEGEGTYALNQFMGVDLTGWSIFANGALMSSRSGGASGATWEPNAPNWTGAVGLLYKSEDWRFALIDKVTGQAYNDTDNLKYYEYPAYNNLNAMIGFDIGNFDLSVNADNILNSRQPLLITEATNNQVSSNPATSLDQYQYQAPMSIMFNLKAHL